MKKFLLLLPFFFLTANLNAQYWEKIDSVFAPFGVTVEDFSAPAFGDLDGDGDLDLALGSIELEVIYFENIGTDAIPKFQKDTSMFSSIYAGGYQFTNADYPVLIDLDADLDLDLLIGGYNGILYYENTGNASNPQWTKVDTIFADATSQIGTDAKPSFADLDDDGDYDMIVGVGESLFGGPQSGISMGFRNDGDSSQPVFVRDDNLVTGLPDVGVNAYPTLADIDNDNDFDLLMGRDGAALYYYKNTGTNLQPVWTRDFNLFNGVETTNYWKDPTFTDLDNDGDLDLVYGTDGGDLYYYKNIGTASAPQFLYDGSYFKVIKTDGSSTVSFADWDEDGDLDLLSGSTLGSLFYAKNIGTSASPEFMENLTTFTHINPGFRSSPIFVDIDKDNDLDIVSGYASGGGLILYTNNNGSFSTNSGFFLGVSVPYQSVPAFADIDDDGDLDLLVGADDANTTKFYLNDGNNNFTQNTTLFSNVVFPRGSRPAFADIDNDGDFDLFIGVLFGGEVKYYENTGSKSAPQWTAAHSLMNGIRAKQAAHPGFADLDGDGRLDLILGESDGNFTFYKNTFAVVPVELISFTGSSKGKSVTLNWQTATETNNFGFEIERTSAENGQAKPNWLTVGFVEGKGTTTEQQSYTFSQNDLTIGKYLYRLKQVDFNGTYSYSNEIEINVGAPESFSLEQNFPNPFNPITAIKYSVVAEGKVVLKIFDILGNEISTLVNEIKMPGTYEISFDASHLSSGVYVYKMSTNNFSSTKKMILQK